MQPPAAVVADQAQSADQAQPADQTDDNVLGLDGGQDVVDPNGPGSSYVRETHGDWQMQCVRVEEGQQEPCKLYQLLKDEKGNGVAEFNMFKLPKGQKFASGALVATPLETLLTEQLTITVDGGPKRRYRFTWCAADGCFSRIGFSAADVLSFKKGAGASVTIVPIIAPDQKVNLKLSLTGFTKAYDALPVPVLPAAPAKK